MYEKTENNDIRSVLLQICDTMKQEGYDPVTQLSGYILSEDPIYIPRAANARVLIRSIDRDELLAELISHYLK